MNQHPTNGSGPTDHAPDLADDVAGKKATHTVSKHGVDGAVNRSDGPQPDQQVDSRKAAHADVSDGSRGEGGREDRARSLGTANGKRFTLIELVVVVSILAVLAGVMVPRVTNHMKSARDANRLAGIKTVRTAIEQYYMDKGEYPPANTNSSFGGWDVSHDGNFIGALQKGGYLDDKALDPINNAHHHYRYYVYNKGAYGCRGTGSFYVLGVMNFESASFARRNKGFFKCSGRNWSNQFAYVTGGGASFKN